MTKTLPIAGGRVGKGAAQALKGAAANEDIGNPVREALESVEKARKLDGLHALDVLYALYGCYALYAPYVLYVLYVLDMGCVKSILRVPRLPMRVETRSGKPSNPWRR